MRSKASTGLVAWRVWGTFEQNGRVTRVLLAAHDWNRRRALRAWATVVRANMRAGYWWAVKTNLRQLWRILWQP